MIEEIIFMVVCVSVGTDCIRKIDNTWWDYIRFLFIGACIAGLFGTIVRIMAKM